MTWLHAAAASRLDRVPPQSRAPAPVGGQRPVVASHPARAQRSPQHYDKVWSTHARCWPLSATTRWPAAFGAAAAQNLVNGGPPFGCGPDVPRLFPVAHEGNDKDCCNSRYKWPTRTGAPQRRGLHSIPAQLLTVRWAGEREFQWSHCAHPATAVKKFNSNHSHQDYHHDHHHHQRR